MGYRKTKDIKERFSTKRIKKCRTQKLKNFLIELEIIYLIGHKLYLWVPLIKLGLTITLMKFVLEKLGMPLSKSIRKVRRQENG